MLLSTASGTCSKTTVFCGLIKYPHELKRGQDTKYYELWLYQWDIIPLQKAKTSRTYCQVMPSYVTYHIIVLHISFIPITYSKTAGKSKLTKKDFKHMIISFFSPHQIYCYRLWSQKKKIQLWSRDQVNQPSCFMISGGCFWQEHINIHDWHEKYPKGNERQLAQGWLGVE